MPENAYVAPIYPGEGPISDSRLVELVGDRRPKFVFIALSGGVQERLGWDLRQETRLQAGDPVHRRSDRVPVGPADAASRVGRQAGLGLALSVRGRPPLVRRKS